MRFIKYFSSSFYFLQKKKKIFSSFHSLEGGGLLRFIKYSSSSVLKKKVFDDFTVGTVLDIFVGGRWWRRR